MKFASHEAFLLMNAESGSVLVMVKVLGGIIAALKVFSFFCVGVASPKKPAFIRDWSHRGSKKR